MTRASADVLPRLRSALAQRYHVERELGRGGMATVFLALDLKHGRRVALKVMHPELSTSLGTERFLREIATTGQLVHPHILALYDSGEADGLLYYVMPFLEGESLRQRLEREGPLPLDEAVRIAAEVADALAYAHQRGVVHRDIKPENILLTEGGHACVADFGLARAIYSATNQRLTTTGLTVGSPHYISPEQASGAEADGRADLYSLGCVLFEMLAGRPPFESESTPALLTRHLVEPPPPVQQLRPSVPDALAATVQRALAKRPEERFPDAAALATALREGPEPRRRFRTPTSLRIARVRLPRSRRVGWWVGGGVAAVLVLVAVLASRGALPGGIRAGADADTTLFLVLPFTHDGDGAAALSLERAMGEALARWQDVRVVDPFRARDALARYEGRALTSAEARRVARVLGAGRVLRAEVSRSGGALRLHAALYPADAARPLRQGVVHLRDAAGGGGVLHALADSLLFHHAPPGPEETPVGTTSARARLLYWQAGEPLREWQVASADSLLSAAVALDPQYARALLWLAQWRLWTQDDTTAARGLAERAVAAAPGRLAPREQRHASALAGMLRGDFPEACAGYNALYAEDARDFPAAYNLGECIRRDRLVLPDAASPSGWRFRSSYHRAVLAYQRAFVLWPGTHRAFAGDSFRRIRRLLLTDGYTVRPGFNPAREPFVALAGWQGDSLSLIPHPQEEIASGRRGRESLTVAVSHLRNRFLEIARSWYSARPESAAAAEALAVSLEMLNDPAALEALRRARDLASDDQHRLHLATAEVWLRIKTALPDSISELQAIRQLADSLLVTRPSTAREATQLAALAVLTGRSRLAADLTVRAAEPVNWPVAVPLSIMRSAHPLLLYAAKGGPADSISYYENRVLHGIRNGIAPHDQFPVRAAVVHRSAILAFPAYVSPLLRDPSEALSNPRLAAQRATLEGDSLAVWQYITEVSANLSRQRPTERQFEAVLTHATLLHANDQDSIAIELIRSTLDALSWMEPGTFADFVAAASLLRSMQLYASLNAALGDGPTARRWATAVLQLWESADASMQAPAQQMRRISAGVGNRVNNR